MNSDSAGFAPARLRIAAFASLGQCDGNGLLDRFFPCRRMAGANRSILFPLIHQCLDIAADDRLAGSFSERHDFPLSAESIGRVFHHSARGNRTEIRPIFIALFAMCLFDIRRAFRTHGGDHAPFVHWVRNGQQQLDAAASATNRPAQCAARARGDDPLKQFAPTLTLMPPNSHPSLLHCEGLAEIVGGEAPIDQFVKQRVHVVRAAILIIQIVGVFPHVDGQ